MDKTYDPTLIEEALYQRAEDHQLFAPSGDGEPYCIMIPPPNVTGTLHMGHAFQNTLMDILTRYHRMKGRNTLWQPGTDHAGIATQMVVERQLNAKGTSRQDLGREAFVDEVWKWKEQSGDTITRQLRRLGASLDWTRERFTLDDGLSEAVKEVFVKLHEEGLIYRGKRLVNWDPVLHTALSDLEVISEEEAGQLWHIKYPIVGSDQYLIVATTRPETMLGDSAVAVHPDDERYQAFIGKSIDLPLSNRHIPIIADDYVDPEFGSGCVKITPAHDFNDYQIGQRHKLEMINIFDRDAKINENGAQDFQGMGREQARKAVVVALEALKLLQKTEAHRHAVPRGDRSGTVLEPYLTDQWYVRADVLAEPAIKAVEDGDIRFVPENWSKTYFEWMRNIQDWCISRQLWWGHQIPAWYDADGNVYVARSEQEARSKHQLSDELTLTRDPDVLDTWFSSALWPFSTLGWPEQTSELKTFYPTSVLVTGFDIIFFWVARMIMMGLKFTGEVPFKEVYINALVRDEDGKKMSKSKGNILDPIDLIDGIELEALVSKRTSAMMQPQYKTKIEKATRKQFPDGIPAYGTDALRFTFAALATQGRDIPFDLGRIQGYRNFCNKLWNAARFVDMQTSDPVDTSIVPRHAVNRWIVSRLSEVIASVDKHYEVYRFDLAAQSMYEFVWNEFCDWYVELSKSLLKDEQYRAETLTTMVTVLEKTLRMLHPVMPFISESLWDKFKERAGRKVDFILQERIPLATPIDESALTTVAWIKDFVLGVRQIRGEMDISPNQALPVLVSTTDETAKRRLLSEEKIIKHMAKLSSIDCLAENESPPPSSTALVAELSIHVPIAGLIDPVEECQRLSKLLEKTEKDRLVREKKLANPNFVANAPADVVAKDKVLLQALSEKSEKIAQRLEKMRSIAQEVG